MHELSLLSDLMKKLGALSRENGDAPIAVVRVRLGALSHLSAEHFREHFVEAAAGTPAAGAYLEVVEGADLFEPHAQDIMLESVDLVVPDGHGA